MAERYRVVERLGRFAVADRSLTGVEYEYWLAFDETRAVEVWLQFGDLGAVAASGVQFAGAVAALRRLNHPAFPAILDFGEIEVDVDGARDAGEVGDGEADADVVDADAVDADADAADVVVADVGYAVLEPIEGETLAALLMRGALTEAEVFAALAELADALKLLHEMELVHGHLSAYSVLLTERGVLLVDVAASLALESASDSVLTPAADVYALAWLACVALAGVEAVEAEFGVGFDAASSPEDERAPGFLTAELVERRRAWAIGNLAGVYGIEIGLAGLLVAALGESGGRPSAASLAGALRARGVVGAGEVAGVGEVAAEVVEAVDVVEVAQVEAVVVAESEAVEGVEVAGGVVYGAAESAGAAEVGGAAAVVGGGVAVAMMTVEAEVEAESSSGGYPEAVPQSGGPSRPGQHRRPKSALYVAVAIVVLVAIAIIWGLAARKSPSPSASASGGPSAVAQLPSGSASAAGTTAPAVAPSASASAGVGASASAGASVGAGGGGASSSPSAGVLATAPTSPSQALQQIQQAVSQAQGAGQIPASAQGPLNQAIGTLQQEISSGGSIQQGVGQLRQALTAPGLPASFVSEVNGLIQYLSVHSGS